MTADLASTALITVRCLEQNRHHRVGTVDYQTSTIDIFDDLKQGGNRRAPRTVARSSKRDSDPDQVTD
jgi:hypothetical protein